MMHRPRNQLRLPGRVRTWLLAFVLVAAPVAIAGSVPAQAAPTGKDSTVAPLCGAAAKGYATCFALRRTDVSNGKGLQPKADVAGYGPIDLTGAYSLPAGGGAGQTVAIVDAFDGPNAESDLAVYRAQFGLPPCTTDNGCFRKIDQRGGTDYPVPDAGWAGEISLDVQMVSAIAPLAHILLVEADDNSTANLGASVDQAVAEGAKYVSNSYGSAYTSTPGSGEDPIEVTDFDPHYNHPGVAVVASSGDSDFGVSYPAASQFVTAVGGTSLVRDSSSRGFTESVWHNSFGGPGSGCSVVEAKPAWQTDTGCGMRAEADVSAVADPLTGVAVYNTFQDVGWEVFGGTSVSSPIIAGVYAVAGTPAAGSYPSSYAYGHTNALNDVTAGANGSCSPSYLCTAGPGYDGPTGLGTPNGPAAFSAADRGDITGTITNSATGAPIANAQVGTDRGAAVTDAAGHYDLNLPAGSYDLTVSAFGFTGTTATGVTLAAGGQVTRDFALDPVPSSTLSGTVTDGSGHGWPLYARISVDGMPGGPLFTDPKTGAYSVTLPRGQTFQLHVTPVYTGYQSIDVRVPVGDSDIVRNVAVPVDAFACNAPGYQQNSTAVSVQTFDDPTVPAGWTLTDGTGAGGWAFDDPGGRGNLTGGTGNFAILDSDFLGIGNTEDAFLTSPSFDLSSTAAPVLAFDNDYRALISTADVDYSVDGGGTWTNVWHQDLFSVRGPSHIELPLPQAGGQSDVQVRFHYTGTWAWWWQVDNVAINSASCDPTIHGGLVVGQVTDANTGDGLIGATVSSVDASGDGTTTVGTPEDPNRADGFYWFFSTLTGNHAVSYSDPHYATATRTVNVATNSATESNAALNAGRLTITPTSIDKTVGWQGTAKATLTLKNTGTAPATVNIGERGAATVPLSTKGAQLHTVTPAAGRQAMIGRQQPAAVAPAAATPRNVTPSGPPWTSIVDYPTNIQDNLVASNNGRLYSAFGYDGSVDVNTLYTYDPTLGTWQQLASAGETREHPSGGFINGKLYVAGGWGPGGPVDSNLAIYDPTSNTWNTGAPNPKPYSAAGSAILNGKLYLVGGCGSVGCDGSTDVMVYDSASNSWSQAAPYPEPIAWQACGAIDSVVYCAGGASAASDSAHTYAYDPESNTWSQLPDMPTGLWAAATTVANGTLLISGGVTAVDEFITNEGFAYDPATNAWSSLPNSNNTLYRSGSACGFYRIGGNDGSLFGGPVPDSEVLPGFSNCTTDVSWLSLSSSRVTLQPGKTATVTVMLNAGVDDITQPGTYNASLAYITDTPYPVGSTSISLAVNPPKTWGKIAGTVTTVDGKPLAGVTVQIDSWANNYTLRTDANGYYQLWLDVRNNPLTVIAAKDGYQPQAKTVTIVRGKATTVNWVLQLVL